LAGWQLAAGQTEGAPHSCSPVVHCCTRAVGCGSLWFLYAIHGLHATLGLRPSGELLEPWHCIAVTHAALIGLASRQDSWSGWQAPQGWCGAGMLSVEQVLCPGETVMLVVCVGSWLLQSDVWHTASTVAVLCYFRFVAVTFEVGSRACVQQFGTCCQQLLNDTTSHTVCEPKQGWQQHRAAQGEQRQVVGASPNHIFR
jgi:hypothetical protein